MLVAGATSPVSARAKFLSPNSAFCCHERGLPAKGQRCPGERPAEVDLGVATDGDRELQQGTREFSAPLGGGAAVQDRGLTVTWVNPHFLNKLW